MSVVDLPMPKCSCGAVMVRGDLAGVICPFCDTDRARSIAAHPSSAPRFPQRVERRGPAGLPASRRAISAPWREAALIAGIALIGAVVEGLGWL